MSRSSTRQATGWGVLVIFILTPAGWILRLAGKDLLQLKRQAGATTFWQTAKDASPLDRLF
jgi:hypothetical protein